MGKKRKGGRKKKNVKDRFLGIIPIPVWCGSCNACILGILFLFFGLFAIGMLPGFSPSFSEDNGDNNTTTVPEVPDDEPVQYLLAAKLNEWDSDWGMDGYDITVEVFDAATSSKVHTGLLYDEIYIARTYFDWRYGSTHSDFVSGFMVTIQVWAAGGSVYLTVNDYVDVAVGCAQFTCNLYESIDLVNPIGSITFRWVVA